jgi:hypothetical protein
MRRTVSFWEEIDKINHAFPVVLYCTKCDRLRLMKIKRNSDKLAHRCTACGTARVGSMNAIPERTEPLLWKIEPSENVKLKGELVACEKEKKSLNDLIRHIGETVIRHVRGKD